MNPDIPKYYLWEWDDDVVWLCDLDERGVHFGAAAADGCCVFVVAEDNCAVGAFAVGVFVDFFYDCVFAFAGVDGYVGTVFFGEFEAFVSGVDADYFIA